MHYKSSVFFFFLALAVIPSAAVLSYWPTAHADNSNTGQGTYKGPSKPAACMIPLLSAFQPDDSSNRFYSTGVLSTDNSKLILGDRHNDVIILDIDSKNKTVVTLDQDSVQGIVGDGVLVNFDDFDRFFVGSGSGEVYSLELAACLRGERCVEWKQTLPLPVMAPVRLAPVVGNQSLPWGRLLVSVTSNITDDGGRLYALNAYTGEVLWQFDAKNVEETDTHGIHYVPAVGSHGEIYIAFGSRIVALHPATGAVIGEAKGVDEDPFASSVALSPDLDVLYVHSATGALWQAHLSGNLSVIDIAVQWSCLYRIQGEDCCYPPLYCGRGPHLQGVWPARGGDAVYGTDPQAAPLGRGARPEIFPGNVRKFGILPYASPSFDKKGDIIFAVQFTTPIARNGTLSGDRGLYAVNADNGNRIWSYHGESVPFDSSRSSVTVGVDQTIMTAFQVEKEDVTEPYIIGLKHAGNNYTLLWSYQLGGVDDSIGSSSPIVAQSRRTPNTGRVYMAVYDKLVALDEGDQCPTGGLDGLPCSGHGTCDTCDGGKCTCDNQCYAGPACEPVEDCGPHGHCDPDTGGCVCDPCYTWDIMESECIPNLCSLHGACNATTGQCECEPCYTGDSCENENKCNGHGQCDNTYGCQCQQNFAPPNCATCQPCFYGENCTQHQDCNNHGSCNADTGICRCDIGYGGQDCKPCGPCYYGTNCENYNNCSSNGQCLQSTGECQCVKGYAGAFCDVCDPCTVKDSNGKCTVPRNCNHGHCDNGKCKCNAGWTGFACDREATTDGSNSSGGSNGGAIAAGVLVPLVCLGGLGGFVFYRKRRGLSAFPRVNMPTFQRPQKSMRSLGPQDESNFTSTGTRGYGAL